MAIKSYEVKFKLSDLKGRELGTYTVSRNASKSIGDAQLAGRDIAWHLKICGFKAEILGSTSSQKEATKFEPVRVKIETPQVRAARLAKERRDAKKAAKEAAAA